MSFNPFTAAQNALANRARAGNKRAQAAADRAQAVQETDWLDAQSHGRQLEFMRAQHSQTVELEKLRGGEIRKHMAAGQKQGLSDFSTSQGADGSHSTSFSFDRSQPLGTTPAMPLAGASIQTVGGAPQAPQNTSQKPQNPANTVPQKQNTLPAPTHSGKPTKGGGRQTMLPGTRPKTGTKKS